MKKFIKQYIRIIAYTTIGLMLVVGGFYLIMNYYHSEEVKTNLYIGAGDINIQNYNSKLDDIQSNLNRFNPNNASQEKRVMYNKLLTCNSVLNSVGTLGKIQVNSSYTPKDVYELGTKIQTDLLNICWALHLSYITDENAPSEFKKVGPYVKNSIDLITTQTSFALNEIQNNGSYFYSTSVSSSTIRNYLSSDYGIIANAYNEFADIILDLSRQINMSEGGNIDA